MLDGARVARLQLVLLLLREEALHLGTPIELRIRQPSSDLVLPLKRQAFKRAITNLVTNATRYGDYVVIRASTDKDCLRIEVDDDGPGIPRAERENVFRPFYRLGNDRNQDAGNTGLGLAIARGFVEAMGGTIKAESPAIRKRGTRLVLRLPVPEQAAIEESPA